MKTPLDIAANINGLLESSIFLSVEATGGGKHVLSVLQAALYASNELCALLEEHERRVKELKEAGGAVAS